MGWLQLILAPTTDIRILQSILSGIPLVLKASEPERKILMVMWSFEASGYCFVFVGQTPRRALEVKLGPLLERVSHKTITLYMALRAGILSGSGKSLNYFTQS